MTARVRKWMKRTEQPETDGSILAKIAEEFKKVEEEEAAAARSKANHNK